MRLKPTILAVAGLAGSIGAAAAVPAEIIILRHGEKANSWRLCSLGAARAQALAKYYLGQDAANSLFAPGTGPAAFVVITLHTLELAAPAAESWGLPLDIYSALPGDGAGKAEATALLNRRTGEAVRDVMSDNRFDGKTVVMAWEHHHIADAKLEKEYPGEAVTLRRLLNLGGLPDVPETWPGENYDYFWIVSFAPGSKTPSGFRMVRQEFPAPFASVPANAWKTPNGMPADSGCLGAEAG